MQGQSLPASPTPPDPSQRFSLHEEPTTSSSPVRMLNGRVYGSRRATEQAERIRKSKEANEPAFVEWGYGKAGGGLGNNAPKTAGRGFLEDSEEGSGMEWVKKRREARVRDAASQEGIPPPPSAVDVDIVHDHLEMRRSDKPRISSVNDMSDIADPTPAPVDTRTSDLDALDTQVPSPTSPTAKSHEYQHMMVNISPTHTTHRDKRDPLALADELENEREEEEEENYGAAEEDDEDDGDFSEDEEEEEQDIRCVIGGRRG